MFSDHILAHFSWVWRVGLAQNFLLICSLLYSMFNSEDQALAKIIKLSFLWKFSFLYFTIYRAPQEKVYSIK